MIARIGHRPRTVLLLLPFVLTGEALPSATVASDRYGVLADGRPVRRFTLANGLGMTVEIIEYGAAIARIAVPDRAGTEANVVLSPGNLAGFVGSRRRYGAIVGRYAGRLRGSVAIDGTVYPLSSNASGVTLHGGDPGFDRAIWRGRRFASRHAVGVELRYRSMAGEQGFPGTLDVAARYTLARYSNVLSLDITANADRPTVANLTNHSYFNLAGNGGSVACHRLEVGAQHRVAVDGRGLPTGELPAVAGGPLDLTGPVTLGRLFASTNPLIAGGLDHMLVLGHGGTVRLVDVSSGRAMTLSTTEPGVQIYTANALDGSDRDSRGRPLVRHGGVAIEPEHLPDSPWIAAFPSTRVDPGRSFNWHATWSFSAEAPGQCTSGASS